MVDILLESSHCVLHLCAREGCCMGLIKFSGKVYTGM